MEPSDAIKQHLEPRLLTLGFVRTADQPKSRGYWAFQRGDLRIALALDARNGELSISLCDSPSKRLMEFWLFGEFVGDHEVAKMGSITPTRSGYEEPIIQLTEAIERHSNLLRDWSAGFAERLFVRQSEVSAAAWRKQRLSDALQLADICWLSRDYAGVVRLLGPFESELSPAILGRVRYAYRKAKEGSEQR